MLIEQTLIEEKEIEGAVDEAGSQDGADRFKNLLDAYEPQTPRRGEIVQGEILRLEDNLAFIDIGAKRDAVVPPQEMEEVTDGLLDELDEGTAVPVYVVRTPVGDGELIVSLEKGQREKDWERAARCLDSQEVLEQKVIDRNKGGLLVEFGRLQGFVPNSHVPALQRTRDRQERMTLKAKMIGSSLSVKVLEIEREHERLLLSAKGAREKLQDERLAELEEGQIVAGRVVNLVDYGAFVDLGGVTGLLHISKLSWHRVDDPADVLDVGQEIEVAIDAVDPEKKRVGLTRKPLLPNMWQQFAQQYEIGDLIEGEVSGLADFGAFVLLPLAIEGLVHVSEMDMPASVAPADVLQPGDRVLVRITSIAPDKKRVGLSMRRVSAAEELAWLASQKEDEAI